jgi:hypothetical protein
MPYSTTYAENEINNFAGLYRYFFHKLGAGAKSSIQSLLCCAWIEALMKRVWKLFHSTFSHAKTKGTVEGFQSLGIIKTAFY